MIPVASLSKEDREALRKKIKDHYLTSPNEPSFQELEDEFRVARSTIHGWATKDKWVDVRNRNQTLLRKMGEKVAFLLDPKTETEAILSSNLTDIAQIQGLHINHIKYAMATGDKTHIDAILPLGIADALQKSAAALEKLNNTLIKQKNDGVEKTEVRHIHQVDMNDAVRVALEAKAQGQVITVNEAAKALDKQRKGSK